jgi:hypothetical protein
MSYSEQLKSPKWQKKRLEIFNRDEFTCKCCNSKEKQLNVHHKTYTPNFKAWEYKDSVYVTLCGECHELLHKANDLLNNKVFKYTERCINDYSICLDESISKDLCESLNFRYSNFNDFLFHNDFDKSDIYIFDQFNSVNTQHEYMIVVDEIDFDNSIIYISRLEVYK